MYYIEHCKNSITRFGENGSQYHKRLDSYKLHGWKHRFILHHKEGVEIGVQIFGEQARKHLEQHIKDDWNSNIIPSIKKVRKFEGSSYPLKIV